MKLERSWKKAYEEGFCEDEQSKSIEPTGLSVAQKHWLVRAWTCVFGEVPNAMPVEDRTDGVLAVQKSKGKTQWHHLYPRGASIRLAGEDPDRPENAVPLDEFNHVGKGLVGEVEPDSPIIHQDNVRAHRQYSQNKNSYKEVQAERREKTARGESYWIETYDGWFAGLARFVTSKYQTERPDDKFPAKKHRRKK